jgi:hypothetical protein
MKKQTSVEWLIEQLESASINDYSFAQPHKIIALDISTFQTLIDQAKAMEKQQIIDAYKSDRHPCSDEDAEQYYTETFTEPKND